MRCFLLITLLAGLSAPGCKKRGDAPKPVEVVIEDLLRAPAKDQKDALVVEVKKEAPGGLPRTINVSDVRNTLAQLALAYHGFFSDRNRGPNDVQELAPYFEKNAKIMQALDPKEGYITFQWKAHLLRMPAGTSNTILAFETIADRNGQRNVVMADRSVTQMDEETFKKAPKAGN